MKNLLFGIGVVLSLALFAPSARAVDVTGQWAAQVSMPDGNSFQLAFAFKQDGSTLTGSVQGPQGDAVAITDGKVDGDKISFKVTINGTTITHDGTVNASGDEIKLNTKSDSGDFPTHDMILRRVKDVPQPGI